MKKQPSQKAILVRYLLFLPLLAGLLYSFSSTETIVQIERNVASPEHQKTIDIGFLNNVDTSQDQDKATPKMVAEYQQWAKHYKENNDALVETKIWKRMKYTYSIMTPDQKKNSEKFPDLNSKQIITVVEDEDNPQNKAAREKTGEIPAPPTPEVTKGGDVPPPPPPPPAPPIEGDQVVPPPPPAPEQVKVPAPPPPPPSPEEAVKRWIEEGADFYLNGKRVSGKEALEAVQEHNGKNLSVQVEENASGKTVKLSTKKKKKNPKQASKNLKSGNLKNTFIGPPQEQDLLKANC